MAMYSCNTIQDKQKAIEYPSKYKLNQRVNACNGGYRLLTAVYYDSASIEQRVFTSNTGGICTTGGVLVNTVTHVCQYSDTSFGDFDFIKEAKHLRYIEAKRIFDSLLRTEQIALEKQQRLSDTLKILNNIQ